MQEFDRRKLLLTGAATGAVLFAGCETNGDMGPENGGGTGTNPTDPVPDPTPDPIPDPTPDPVPDPTPDPAPSVFLRENIHDLGTNHPVVNAYRNGVAVMKSRDVNDPTSWMYQANMHGTSSMASAGQLWNMCRHGSGQFLPWHRMYIYFFERMIREASGDPTFALPYWDYSKSGQAMMPLAFRSPANSSNSLYNSTRNFGVNNGNALPFSTVTGANSMTFDQFIPTGMVPGFGSGNSAGTSSGQLEFQPHNVVHVAIGGDMGHPWTAGRDPIFWLHHCNVDRIWSAWLAQPGHSNPTGNAAWMNQTFDFFDENGTRVTMSNAEILDSMTMGSEGYIYADFDVQAAGGADQAAPEAGPAIGVPATETGEIALGALTKTVDMEPAIGQQSASGANTQISTAKHAALVLEDVSATGDVGVYYEIYLNLPDGTDPDPSSIYYVGVLDYFSAQGGGHGHGSGDTSTKRYEISRLLKKQRDAGIFTDLNKPPKLTFIANGMARNQSGGLQVNTAAQPVIGRSRIETAQ